MPHGRSQRFARSRRAFTLVEIVVVMAILVTLAGLALLKAEGISQTAQVHACDSTLVTVRDAILGSVGAPGYRTDVGELPGVLADLLRKPAAVAAFDVVSKKGWDGPYLAPGVRHVGTGESIVDPYASSLSQFAPYGAPGDPAIFDPWLSPIVLQIPQDDVKFARLVSAGPDRILATDPDATDLDPTAAAQVGDDLVLFLTHVPGSSP